MKITLKQLAEKLGAELTADSSAVISAVAPIDAAGGDNVTFITDIKHLSKLKTSKAAAVVTAGRIDGIEMPQLIVKNVQKALIQAQTVLAPELEKPKAGIHKTAVVADSAKIAKTASIGPCAVIEANAQIGENTVISSCCKVGENSVVGSNTKIESNVVIYHNCFIGNNVIIGANATIGSIGFGYYFIEGAHKLIPHNGSVVIEDFVEIGANSCIDRAKFGQTRIGAGTKIDNLVQIAHNVVIGRCCLIAGQSGIAGSTTLGDGVVLAGHCGVIDNLKIGDRAVIAAQSTVFSDVEAGSVVYGTPAEEYKTAQKMLVHTKRLPKYVEQIKQLTKRIETLEASEHDKK